MLRVKELNVINLICLFYYIMHGQRVRIKWIILIISIIHSYVKFFGYIDLIFNLALWFSLDVSILFLDQVQRFYSSLTIRYKSYYTFYSFVSSMCRLVLDSLHIIHTAKFHFGMS